jgi:hypothetical protein
VVKTLAHAHVGQAVPTYRYASIPIDGGPKRSTLRADFESNPLLFPRRRESLAFPSRDPRLGADEVITNQPVASGPPRKIALINLDVKLLITPLSI